MQAARGHGNEGGNTTACGLEGRADSEAALLRLLPKSLRLVDGRNRGNGNGPLSIIILCRGIWQVNGRRARELWQSVMRSAGSRQEVAYLSLADVVTMVRGGSAIYAINV